MVKKDEDRCALLVLCALTALAMCSSAEACDRNDSESLQKTKSRDAKTELVPASTSLARIDHSLTLTAGVIDQAILEQPAVNPSALLPQEVDSHQSDVVGTTGSSKAEASFEVATIKAANPADTGMGFQNTGSHLHVRNETAAAILCFAFGIHPEQLQGGPSWLNTVRWEIDGIGNVRGEPSLLQIRAMYRRLLTDRFGLQLHEESRVLPVYVLSIEKSGEKLTPSGQKDVLPDSTGNQNSGINDMQYKNITLGEFAQDLAFSEDRPIVDVTGLMGRYNFHLRWTSSDAAAAGQVVGLDTPPLLFTAVREQLGLSLKAARRPVAVYRVAQIQKPSAN